MSNVSIVKDKIYLEHKPGHTHPEHPHRIKTIYKMIDTVFGDGLNVLKSAKASLDQLELVHTSTYIKKVLKTAEHRYTSLAPDTPAGTHSFIAACSAAGGCLEGLNALIAKDCEVCFSLIRPPGHHALRDRAGGFCIFNNAAITARYAVKKHGIKRILIVDWDVHHGNGVNDLFYDCKEIFYMSTHDTFLYPYTGDWLEAGSGEGEGYTVNLPIPRDFNDEDLLCLYKDISTSVMERFRPELILVCAGFDAHQNDPIGRSRMTEKVFKWLTHLFLHLREQINRPPVLYILEGGYDFRALAGSIRQVLGAMKDKDHAEALPKVTSPSAEALVLKAREIHGRYGVWTD